MQSRLLCHITGVRLVIVSVSDVSGAPIGFQNKALSTVQSFTCLRQWGFMQICARQKRIEDIGKCSV